MSLIPDEYGNTYGLCPNWGLRYNKFPLPNMTGASYPGMGTMGMGMNMMGTGALNTNYLSSPAPLDAFVYREKDETAVKAIAIGGTVALVAGTLWALKGKGGIKALKEAAKAAKKNIKPTTEAAENVVKKSKYTLTKGKYKIKTPQAIAKKGPQEVAKAMKEVAKPTAEAAENVVKKSSEAAPTFYNKPKSPSKIKANHYWEYTAEQNKLNKEVKQTAETVEKISKPTAEVVKKSSEAAPTFYNKSKSPSKIKTNHYWEYTAEQNKLNKEIKQTAETVKTVDGKFINDKFYPKSEAKTLKRNPALAKGKIKLAQTTIPMEGGGNTIIKTNPVTKAKVQQINVDPKGRIEQITKFDSKTGKVVEDIQYTKGQIFSSTKYNTHTGAKIEETIIFDGGKGIRKYNPETGKLMEEINFKGGKVQSITKYDEVGKKIEQKYIDGSRTEFSTKVTNSKINTQNVRNNPMEKIPADKRIIENPYPVNISKEPLIESAYLQKPTGPIIESAYIYKPTGPIIESAYVQKPAGKIILP